MVESYTQVAFLGFLITGEVENERWTRTNKYRRDHQSQLVKHRPKFKGSSVHWLLAWQPPRRFCFKILKQSQEPGSGSTEKVWITFTFIFWLSPAWRTGSSGSFVVDPREHILQQIPAPGRGTLKNKTKTQSSTRGRKGEFSFYAISFTMSQSSLLSLRVCCQLE